MTKKKEPVSKEHENPEAEIEESSAPPTEEVSATAEAPASGEPNASVEEQLAAAKEESRQNFERYLRAVADWENYRRRMTREKEELRRHAISGFVEEFLPVLDNLDIGLETSAKHPEAANVVAGFQMVADQIRAVLQRNGVKEIDPHAQEFDPHQHESVSHLSHDEIPDNHVIEVLRKGYSINDRLLRPARVVVSSGPAEDKG